MKDVGWHVGMGLRQNPFLQIPLLAKYHTGSFGIDAGVGVLSWERLFGTQVEWLEWVDDHLAYPVSIFELARNLEERP